MLAEQIGVLKKLAEVQPLHFSEHLGFCSRSSIAAYPITYISVNYLDEGSLSDQRVATNTATEIRKGHLHSLIDFYCILFTLSGLTSDDMTC